MWDPWEAQAGKSWEFGVLCLAQRCKSGFWMFQKRVCRLLDTIPREAGAQLLDCAMDLDPRQKFLPDSAPWAAKSKQNSMVSSHCPHVRYKIPFQIHFDNKAANNNCPIFKLFYFLIFVFWPICVWVYSSDFGKPWDQRHFPALPEMCCWRICKCGNLLFWDKK